MALNWRLNTLRILYSVLLMAALSSGRPSQEAGDGETLSTQTVGLPCQAELIKHFQRCLASFDNKLKIYDAVPDGATEAKRLAVKDLCSEYGETLQCFHVALHDCPPTDEHFAFIAEHLGNIRGFMEGLCAANSRSSDSSRDSSRSSTSRPDTELDLTTESTVGAHNIAASSSSDGDTKLSATWSVISDAATTTKRTTLNIFNQGVSNTNHFSRSGESSTATPVISAQTKPSYDTKEETVKDNDTKQSVEIDRFEQVVSDGTQRAISSSDCSKLHGTAASKCGHSTNTDFTNGAPARTVSYTIATVGVSMLLVLRN